MTGTIERTIDQNPLSFEQKLAHIRPKTFADYIGQKAVVDPLSLFIDAAKVRGESLDHVLLFGPPGLGKTTLAHIIAETMGGNFKQTSGPVLEKAGDLAATLSSIEQNDVLFIDEIHRLNSHIEEILYPAMEDFKLDLLIGEGPAARSVQIDLPPFTLVGATTRAGSLTSPLRARFGIAHRLEFYDTASLAQIIKRSSSHYQCPIDEEAAIMLAQRSRGTPRIANRLLRRVRDYAQAHHLHRLSLETIEPALRLLGIDSYGFDPLDRSYIKTLCIDFQGGPVGLESISVSMGEEKHTVEDVIEPYLIQQGYVLRTPRGRIPSQKLEHILNTLEL